VRVEAYGSNADVLFDPYAVQPVVRARDVDAVPSAIGEDYAVYYEGGDTSNAVVGYRSLDGDFYDARGQDAEASEIVFSLQGRPVFTGEPTSAAFRHAPTRVVVLPRLGASVRPSPALEAYLYYQGLAQAPPAALAFPSLLALESLSSSRPTPSAALRPERAEEAGGGLRFQPRPGVRVELAGFHRQYRDLAGLFHFLGSAPTYTGYASAYDALVYGGTATVEARLGGLDALASVTASREPLLLAERFTLPYNLLGRSDEFSGILGGDPDDAVWRQALTAALAYTTASGTGPSVGERSPLGGLRFGAVAQARSGRPYRARGEFGQLTREIERAPAFVQLDLRAEKAVRLAGAELAAALWVENALGRTNVLEVYPTTGRPDDPGGTDAADYFENVVSPNLRPAAEAQYALLARNPSFYGRPRQIRLALALRF
jgi:hypothetical protein